MSEITDILKYILPSLVVFGTAYYLLRLFFENEQKSRAAEARAQTNQVVLPLRIQAYERIVMFLERSNPGNLILRVNEPGMTVRQLQKNLIASIREEYEHNLSQQVYVTPKSWELVKNAKEDMIKTINMSASGFDEEAPSMLLAQKIFEEFLTVERPLIVQALEVIKKEVAQLF